MAGMKYKDIAEKYGTTINTVKSWKKRYAWNREGAPKEKRVCTQNKKGAQVEKIQIDDGTKETLQNTDLTSEQQMFCIYYSRTFNAAQSYQKAYGCQYTTAVAHGYKLLSNVVVRAEIERLKEIKRQQIVASADDIVELQMRIAFADAGNYATFGNNGINWVHIANSNTVDTQIIQEIKEGKTGVSIKLADKQKAIDWLTKYFLMHPESKYRVEYERKRAEVKDNAGEEILKNMQTIADILRNPVANRTIEDFEENADE